MRKKLFFSIFTCLWVLLAASYVSGAGGRNVSHTECHPENGEFLCKSEHECITWSKFCDKNEDCTDGSDEFSGCETLCQGMKCEHGCLPDPDSPGDGMCSCQPGFKISGRRKDKCLNINECKERWGSCSQRCNDTEGSFVCSCIDGFVLQSNNRTCAPKDRSAEMVFAVKNGVRAINIASRKERVVVERSGQTVGVSVDVRRGFVYYTDVTDRMEAIYRSKMDGESEPETVVDTGLVLAESVAFDWVADNIYFSDSNLSHIGVCERNGRACTILVQEKIDKPREIALFPQEAIMFWTDWGIEPSILRSGMDGSNPVAIVRTDLKWPNGIVVDFGTSRLYWIDASHDKIESSDFDGGDRRTIRNDKKGEHGFSLQIFGDNLYWSDWGFDRIASTDKFYGEEDDVLISAPKNLINGLALYHTSAQPTIRDNPCKATVCSHICVLSPKSSPIPYKCLCPVGMRLSPNKRTCKDDSAKPQLFIAHEATLKRKYFNAIGNDVLNSTTLEGLRTISAIAYNALNGTFILFDTYRKHIYTYDPESNKVEALVTRHLDSVKGLDVDPVAQNLYWVDAGRKKIEVFSLITKARLYIYHETQDVLVDVVAVPEFRSIFVATYDEFSGKILKMSMDGLNVDVIVQTSRGMPSSLAYHPEYEHIFWSDVKRGTIEHATVDGHQRFMGAEEIGSPYTMTVYGNKMYWIDRSNKALKSLMIGSNSRDPPTNIRSANRHFNGSQPNNFSAYLGVLNKDLFHVQDLIDNHSCSPKSAKYAGCSHICVLAEEEALEATCLCPEGMVLGSDQKTCEALTECNFSLFQCKSSCVSLESQCDGVRDCPSGEDELNCTKNVTCRASDFVCKSDNTCVQSIWRCDGEKDCRDGSDEEGCEIKACQNAGDFRCKLGRCIPASWKCDHVVDCPDTDASDEEECTYTCQPDEFKCTGGKGKNLECISNQWVCDGEPDCEDGSDENEQCAKECKKDQFKCMNHQCIRLSKVCNGKDDCGDGSDEASCEVAIEGRSATGRGRGSSKRNTTTTEAPQRCPSDQFWCSSGECIPLRKVCDGKPHCRDESDESETCDVPCSMDHECADKCVNTPTGPKCSCSSGFRLGKDGKSCEDIDECLDNVCHHYCQNLKGGYKCTCHDEYSLKPADHQSCKPKGSSPLFIYEYKSKIFVTPQDMLNATAINLPAGTTVSGLDVDVHTSAVFFTNAVKGTISRVYINKAEAPEVLVTGLSSPTEIAYDWVTGNVYVVSDTASGREMRRNLVINICNIGREAEKRKCSVLHHLEEVHQVTSLKLAPHENFLFWSQLIYTNYGVPKGTIARGRMDRMGTKYISIEKVNKPVSLAVDHVFKRVLWIDRETKSIEAVNFDGKRRSVIISPDEKKVSVKANGLGLYDNWIIWNDEGKNIRCRIDMQTGECMHIKVPDAPKVRYSAIMQRTLQPAGKSPCGNSACEYICAGPPVSSSSSSSSSTSYNCFCPTDYDTVDSNHKKCTPKPKRKAAIPHVNPSPRRPSSIWRFMEDESKPGESQDNLELRAKEDEQNDPEGVTAEPVNESDATTIIAVSSILAIILICLIVAAVVVYRQRNGRPKLAIRPYVQQWVKYVNDPVQRWRGGRREQLSNNEAYGQVYEAGNDHAYSNPVYDDVHNQQSKKSGEDGSKGEARSYPDSGILTLNDNDGYDFEDDIHNGHYVSYSQTDCLIDKEFV